MKAFITAILLCSTASAWADDVASERCAKGVELAAKNDLPRASLYLDGCTDEASSDAAARVAKKIRASDLAALSISTTPDGLTAETDALPGETFTTPATIYAKPGTYSVTVQGLTQKVTLAARSRGTVIIDARVKTQAPRDGKADFSEDTPEQTAHKGPPPDVKRGSIVPKKYLGIPDDPSGPEIDDPFAYRDSHLAWRFGVRVGGGFMSQGDSGVGVSVAALASRPLDGPAFLAARVDYNHRTLDTIGVNAGVSVKLVETASVVLLAGGALRGEIHMQDTLAMQPVARATLGGAADLDLAILSLPVALGLRYEQGFTELLSGSRDRAVLLEAGYDWR
ncbi:MAG TPA: hypothetical protein VMZ53_10785 [Kofleriaceae bacterium]|nr:hypothetical protein [Kofleriaceae bacterium]